MDAYYRALVSFPTRRSSDLHGADGPGTVTWSYSMVLLVAEGTLSGLSSDGAAIRLYQTSGGTIIGSTAGSEGAISDSNTDRKSTRLNSSHVKISYAVFCLKK